MSWHTRGRNYNSERPLATAAARALVNHITDTCLERYPEKVERSPSTGKLNFIDLELSKEIHFLEEGLHDAIYNYLLFNKCIYLSRSFGRPNSNLRKFFKDAGIKGDYLPDNMVIKVLENTVTVTINGQNLFKGSIHDSKV